jgi:hypothetical protein
MKNTARKTLGLFLITLASSIFIGCTTAPKNEAPVFTSPDPRTNEGYQIDVVGLERFLGMNMGTGTLGYFERRYNTCEVGYGYPKSYGCQDQYYVVINYQLLCRQSEGTVSETIDSSSLNAVRYKNGRWNMGGRIGSTQTDHEGKGQIKGIFPRTQRSERVKVAIDSDFLYARGSDFRQVLTPADWCR